jgi:hypothetical protein
MRCAVWCVCCVLCVCVWCVVVALLCGVVLLLLSSVVVLSLLWLLSVVESCGALLCDVVCCGVS